MGMKISGTYVPDGQHDHEHFFKGVCICSCVACTEHPGKTNIKCICEGCASVVCGLRVGKRIGGDNVVR